MTTRSARIEAALIAMLAWHRVYHGADDCTLCVQAAAALAPESGTPEPTSAYASLLRVAQKYVAFCCQAGVKADASSLDPTEQLHAQANAAIQRAKVAALPPPSSDALGRGEGEAP